MVKIKAFMLAIPSGGEEISCVSPAMAGVYVGQEEICCCTLLFLLNFNLLDLRFSSEPSPPFCWIMKQLIGSLLFLFP